MDLARTGPSSGIHESAILAIEDKVGFSIQYRKVSENDKVVFNYNGQNYAVEVGEVAAGFTANSKWTDLKTYPTSDPVTVKSDFKTLGIGDSFTGPVVNLTVSLADLSAGTGANNANLAIIDITDPSGAVINQFKVGDTDRYIFNYQGQNYAVEVDQTALGYMLSANWVSLKLYRTSDPVSGPLGFSTLNIGGVLDAGNYKVQLLDLCVATGSDYRHPAVVSILDINDTVIKQFKIDEKEKYVFNYNGQKYAVEVDQTAPGITYSAKWARLKTYPTTAPLTEHSEFSVLNLGRILDAGNYKLWLNDLSVGMGSDNHHSAILTLINSTNVVVDQFKVDEKGKYIFNVDGKRYAVEADQTTPGSGLNSHWVALKTYPTTESVTSPPGFRTVGVGDNLAFENFFVRLSDLSISTTSNNERHAILDLLDQTGNLVNKFQVPENGRYVFEYNGKNYAVEIDQTAPGFTLNSKWVKMKVSSTSDPVTAPKPSHLSYGKPSIGESLTYENFHVRLADLSGGDALNSHPAILDITDGQGLIYGRVEVDPLSPVTWTQPGTGNQVKITVYQTAPGYTLNAKWAEIGLGDVISSVHDLGPIEKAEMYAIENAPNPFNTEGTRISFALPKDAHIQLKVFDLFGREVAQLANEDHAAGQVSVPFRPDANLASGTYVCRLEVDGQVVNAKTIILLK
jgi:hypothetical protein